MSTVKAVSRRGTGTSKKKDRTLPWESTGTYKISVAEPVELKLFEDLEPEPEINLNKHSLHSVWQMLGQRKAHLYSSISIVLLLLLLNSFKRQYMAVAGAGAGAEMMDKVGAGAENK